jgi:hypothetical protein
MKRAIFLTASAFLGFLIQLMLHAAIEIPYLALYGRDPDRFSFGLSWQSLVSLHHLLATVLAIVGVLLGYRQGRKWWQHQERN